jgi:superfamily II DNA/RNA helicase
MVRYKAPDLSAVTLATGGKQRRASARLQKSTQLVVGTPEHVLEMFALRKLKGVTSFVIDEPEPILGSRDAEYLYEILSRPEPKTQLIFVGATFGAKSEQWIKNLAGETALRARIVDNPLVSRISHGCVRVRHEGEKDFVLTRFFRENHCQRAIAFVNQPNLIRHLYRYLSEQGLHPVTVNQERTKQQCKQAIADFNQSKAKVLLTTDRFAVGLDVAAVDWVLHYELPNSAQAYVHRAGRTGRAGRSGTSIVFASDGDRVKLKILERELGFEFDRSPPLTPTQNEPRRSGR